jgi:hypothetical protein
MHAVFGPARGGGSSDEPLPVSLLLLSTDGSERQNRVGPFHPASKTTPDGDHMTLEIHESSKGRDRQATLTFRRKQAR